MKAQNYPYPKFSVRNEQKSDGGQEPESPAPEASIFEANREILIQRSRCGRSWRSVIRELPHVVRVTGAETEKEETLLSVLPRPIGNADRAAVTGGTLG